eukprot:Gb_31596 [translate_table: standard]
MGVNIKVAIAICQTWIDIQRRVENFVELAAVIVITYSKKFCSWNYPAKVEGTDVMLISSAHQNGFNMGHSKSDEMISKNQIRTKDGVNILLCLISTTKMADIGHLKSGEMISKDQDKRWSENSLPSSIVLVADA